MIPGNSRLFNYVSRILVVPECCEFRMPEPIRFCPLQEFYLSYGLGAKPNAFLHFLGSQFVAPTRLVRVRQIDEGHHGRGKMTNFFEDLPTWKPDWKPFRKRDNLARIAALSALIP